MSAERDDAPLDLRPMRELAGAERPDATLLRASLATVLDEVERRRADAARYAWFKTHVVSAYRSGGGAVVVRYVGAPTADGLAESQGSTIDAAIDAAMAQESAP